MTRLRLVAAQFPPTVSLLRDYRKFIHLIHVTLEDTMAQAQAKPRFAPESAPDAIALLNEDHEKVKKAVRAAIYDDDLIDEAEVDHAEAKELIAKLKDMEPADDH